MGSGSSSGRFVAPTEAGIVSKRVPNNNTDVKEGNAPSQKVRTSNEGLSVRVKNALAVPLTGPIPKKFVNHYKLDKELGSGAFSVVKKGISMKNNQSYAVKIVNKKKLTDEDLHALLTEISILDNLDHPHIIKLYETFDEGNDFYIVTELVEGGELFDRIVSKSHYTEKEARDLVKLLIETMAYIHKKGIVHRDLKPENLLLTSLENDADIKVCDFGFAKKICDLLPDETACGTPGYVAPEILRGDPYGQEVDVWSMGVICYVLLAGYPPFYDEDQRKLFKKIKDGRYYFHDEYWSHVSTDAMDLIRKMLCVNQKQRLSAEELLSHPWIIAGDEELDKKDLTGAIVTLKKFTMKSKFRAAAEAVMITNRMNRILKFDREIKEFKATADSIEDIELESSAPGFVKEKGSPVKVFHKSANNAPTEDSIETVPMASNQNENQKLPVATKSVSHGQLSVTTTIE